MVWKRKLKNREKEAPAQPLLRSLQSKRMTLIAATPSLVKADLVGPEALASALESKVPPNWPPDLYDREPMQYVLRQLEDPAERSWSTWYLINTENGERETLGICGFKGRPDAAGSVEIGYSVLSQYRNQGFATEAVERLVTWAFSHQSVLEVCAETLPHLKQSIRVMQKNGFSYTGAGSELGVVRYAVQRPDRR